MLLIVSWNMDQKSTRQEFSFPLVTHTREPYTTLISYFSPGFQSKELIVRGGLKLGDVDQYPLIDVTIDGADEYTSIISETIFWYSPKL